MFLENHLPNCTITNPCPTCQAIALLRQHDILDDVLALKQEHDTQFVPQGTSIFDETLDDFCDRHNLSARTHGCLKNDNLDTVRKICEQPEAEMLRTPNFGRKSLNELKEALAADGLRLGMKFKD